MAVSTSSDVFFQNVLPSMIDKRLDEWIEGSSSISIFVTGKTGTGKSTLVNSIVGSVVSPEGHTVYPETNKVLLRDKEIGGIQVNVWDSPGLQDGTSDEEKYLADIKDKCKGKVDLFLYCVDMSKTRFVPGNRDILAMKKLSETLGYDMWKNTLIVLTFANKYVWQVEDEFEDDPEGLQKEFVDEVDSWKDIIHSALQNEVGLDPQLVKNIEVAPAGDYRSQVLPGDVCWLSNLWGKAVTVTRQLAQPAFVIINEKRLTDTSKSICLPCDQPLLLVRIGRIIGEKLGVAEIGLAIGYQKAKKILFQLAQRNGYFSSEQISVEIDSYRR